jgi:succinyl-CoA synthetase beta subunit
MKLLEYQAHELLGRFGVPCSAGVVVTSPEGLAGRADSLSFPLVVKAQVQTGGRGKAGGVRVAANERELALHAAEIFRLKFGGQSPAALFLTGKKDIRQELYLSIVLDRKRKQPVLIFSAEGGVDINETASLHAEKVVTVGINPGVGIQPFTVQYVADRVGLSAGLAVQLAPIIEKLYALFRDYDCLLAEINPLAVDGSGTLAALDAKIEIDDNSLIRHPDMEALRDGMCSDALVKRARGLRFLYIPIAAGGSIGVISNGSGMIMSSIDMLSAHGLKTACALDLGGGATADRIWEAVRIVLSSSAVKLVFVNIFGGITRCEEVAGGVVRAAGENAGKRFVVRMEGTNRDKGLAICAEAPREILLVDGLDAAIGVISGALSGSAGAKTRKDGIA